MLGDLLNLLGREEEGMWESGPRNDLCNIDNTALCIEIYISIRT